MKKIIFIGITFLLFNCDPEARLEKIIENNSSYDIWLIGTSPVGLSENLTDSFLLSSNTEYIIYSNTGSVGSLNKFEDCPYYPEVIDTIKTRIEGDDTLNLSFVIDVNSNWEFKITDSKGASRTSQCRLIIQNSDIE